MGDRSAYQSSTDSWSPISGIATAFGDGAVFARPALERREKPIRACGRSTFFAPHTSVPRSFPVPVGKRSVASNPAFNTQVTCACFNSAP